MLTPTGNLGEHLQIKLDCDPSLHPTSEKCQPTVTVPSLQDKGARMYYTDKIVFQGSPAQFVAVIEEYGIDSAWAGTHIGIKILYPTKKVSTARSNHMFRLTGLSEVEYDTEELADVQFQSPRCSVEISTDHARFTISALIKRDGSSQLTLRADDEQDHEVVIEQWKAICSYVGNHGWLETKDFEELPKPEAWTQYMSDKGMTNGTSLWWGEVTRLTLRHWTEKGYKSLTITDLSQFINRSRDDIYKYTTLKASEFKKAKN